jgi:hypothetical protein
MPDLDPIYREALAVYMRGIRVRHWRLDDTNLVSQRDLTAKERQDIRDLLPPTCPVTFSREDLGTLRARAAQPPKEV